MEHEGSADKTVLSLRKKRACSVEGCEAAHYTKTYCQKHYMAQRYLLKKAELKQKASQYRKNNREHVKLLKRAEYLRNREKLLESKKIYYSKKAEELKAKKRAEYELNKDAVLARNKSYRKNNSEKIRKNRRQVYTENKAVFFERNAHRRAAKIAATPKWLSATQKAEIRQKYELAAKWTKETGVKHVVDHTSPLKSEQICGLHVPWNLRVIPEALNASKNNKIDTALIADPNGHRDIHVSELNSAPAITAKSG